VLSNVSGMEFQTSFCDVVDACQRNTAAHRAGLGQLRALK
jgi:hypothetical protein